MKNANSSENYFMKKIALSLLIMILSLGICACGEKIAEKEQGTEVMTTEQITTEQTTTVENTITQTTKNESSKSSDSGQTSLLSEEIIGKWISKDKATVFTFKKNGICEFSGEHDLAKGKYKLEDNKLTLDSGLVYKISIKNGVLTMVSKDFGTSTYYKSNQ